MKRFLVLSLFLSLFPSFGFAQTTGAHRISQVVVKGNGLAANVSPGSKILVCVLNTGCKTAANIYLDAALTSPAHNPVTADGSGNYDYYIASGCVDEQISSPGQGSIFVPTVCPFNGQGGGGGGNIVPTPQFRMFLQPNAGTQSIAQGAVVGQNGVAPMLQGVINSDLYATGGGNNGIANALASSQCSGGACLISVPPTSTSTEAATPTVNNTHIADYRKGSRGDVFFNPVVGPGGVNPYGSNGQGGWSLQTIWNDPNFDLTNGAVQTSFNIYPVWNNPGFYWGANYNQTFGVSGSPVTHGLFMRGVGSTPSITNMISSQMDTYHGGDVQTGTFYNNFDGAFIGGADEGTNDFILHRDQHSTWFHGTVNAGATTGTQMLQTTYVAGTLSRTQYAVNGYMLNVSKLVGQYFVAGPTTQVSGYQVFSTPLTTALPSASTAIGTPLTDIPPPPNKISVSTTTVFTLDAGYGAFKVGTACMAGQLYEQVNITAVSPPSGGQQSITYTHSKPNFANQTSLWQGGPCGDFEVPQFTYLNGWGIPYAIIGATDATHIVGRLFTGASSPQAIPTAWATTTANVPLLGLSISGTTVTATISSSLPLTFNGISGATISGSTNSSFNGTTGPITTINGNQLQWTQTGPTGTSANALITIPQSQFEFYLMPGAEVVNPCTSAGCPLGPNSVAWTSGDHVENMLNPSQRGNAITAEETLNSPSFGTLNASNGIGVGGQGRGISGTYTGFIFANSNPCTMYIGCGGLLSPPQGINLGGPIGPAITTDAPVDGSAVFTIRPRYGQQGGATSTNPIKIMTVNAGGLAGTEFYNQPTGEFNFSALTSATVRSPILSTGTGRTGSNAVAFTSANSINTPYAAMGLYGSFGSEAGLDTSATVAAKAFYSGLLYAGALPPTSLGALIVGTSGSSTYSYVYTSVTQTGESLPNATTTTNTGNATLNGTNYVALNMLPGYGAQFINVYRTVGAGYSLGLICTIPPGFNTATGTSGASCLDKGQAATSQQPPTVDTSGQVTSPAGVFVNSLTVAGHNVCQSTGTNCPAAPPIASVGTNGISQPDNSTIGISGGVLSTKGISASGSSCAVTAITNGLITAATCAP